MIPKFRAYDNSSRNRWYEPEEVYVCNGNIFLDDDDFEGWTQNNDVALMQSTGVVDAKGKEIFEGDVVKYRDYRNLYAVVKRYIDGSFRLKLINLSLRIPLSDENYSIEVIGNIYDNPEFAED